MKKKGFVGFVGFGFDDIDPYSYNRFQDGEDDPSEPFLSYEDAIHISAQLKEKGKELMEEGNRLNYLKSELDKRREMYNLLDAELIERETRADVIQSEANTRWAEALAREELLDRQHEGLKVITSNLEKANRTSLEIIDDILLQLELDVSPAEIAVNIRQIKNSLDVKW